MGEIRMPKSKKSLISNRYVFYIVFDLLFTFCSWGAVRLFTPDESSVLGLFVYLWVGLLVSFFLYEMGQRKQKK